MRPDIASQVDETFIIITAISVFLLLLITVCMIYFVFKYSRKRNPKPSNIHGNTTLEVIWTVVPIIIVMFMFYISWGGFENMRRVPDNHMTINVTGQMWKWNFEYDNKKKSDTLYVPVNTPIKMEIRSIDVNHSFYIPGMRVKEDAVPGRVNYLWFEGNEIKTYDIACAEYCGLNHSYMYTKLKVIPQDQFEIWKNTMPPDSTKKDTTNAVLKTDSLKADTSKVDEKKIDTVKTDAVNNKKDTTKR